jgi:hypothetical protein
MGIMKSVGLQDGNKSQQTMSAIMSCILIKDKSEYLELCDAFDVQTYVNQNTERIEPPDWRRYITFRKKPYIHDCHSMIIFRVKDSEGFPVPTYEAILTSGPENSADYFPEHFMGKKQKNDNNPGVLTYYLNYDILNGAEVTSDGEIIREKEDPIDTLGLTIFPYPRNGFVYYEPIRIRPSKELFHLLIKRNSTVLVDITLQRLVSKETFELNVLNDVKISKDFRNKSSSNDAVE